MTYTILVQFGTHMEIMEVFIATLQFEYIWRLWRNYSDYSPWNTYSSNPPVVVDRNGNFYGYFTLNQYAGQRLEDDLTLTLYQYHNSIKDDVNGWYYKLFQ